MRHGGEPIVRARTTVIGAVAGSAPSRVSTVRRNCPLCGANDHDLLLAHPPWQLVRCTRCELAYLPEIPADETVETELDWNKSFSRERRRRWLVTPWMRVWTMILATLRPSREYRALRRIVRFAPGGRLLDIGCGDGRFMTAALRGGFDPLGVELSPQMAAKARRRLGSERVLRGRLADSGLEPESFDVAVTISYLEHDPAPRATLQQVFHLLRPGGICVHKVPNYGSLLRRLLGQRWSGYRWPEHVQYFTPRTLEHLVVQVGFEALRTEANPLGDSLWLTTLRPYSLKLPRVQARSGNPVPRGNAGQPRGPRPAC